VGRKENDPQFQSLFSSVKIDWDAIQVRVACCLRQHRGSVGTALCILTYMFVRACVRAEAQACGQAAHLRRLVV
jgi:hypothetical protein